MVDYGNDQAKDAVPGDGIEGKGTSTLLTRTPRLRDIEGTQPIRNSVGAERSKPVAVRPDKPVSRP